MAEMEDYMRCLDIIADTNHIVEVELDEAEYNNVTNSLGGTTKVKDADKEGDDDDCCEGEIKQSGQEGKNMEEDEGED